VVLYVVTPVCVSRLSPRGNITYCLRLRKGGRTIAKPSVGNLLLFGDKAPDEVIVSTPYGTYQLAVGPQHVSIGKYSRSEKRFKKVEEHEQPCVVFPSFLPDGLGFVLVCRDELRVFRVIGTKASRLNKTRYDALVKCIRDLVSTGKKENISVQAVEALTQYFSVIEVSNYQGFGIYSTELAFAGVNPDLLKGAVGEES
jgi:hypothetical protein